MSSEEIPIFPQSIVKSISIAQSCLARTALKIRDEIIFFISMPQISCRSKIVYGSIVDSKRDGIYIDL